MTARRRLAVALAVVVTVLVVVATIILWPRPERPAYPVTSDGPGLRPSETARAANPPPADDGAAADDDDSAGDDEEPADHRIWVATGELTTRMKFWHVSTQNLVSWRFWPTPGEAPLPDAPSVEYHQQILDFEAQPRTYDEAYWERRVEMSEVRDKMFEQARHDGLTPGQVDVENHPWEALFAVEVEHRQRWAERSAIVREHNEAIREAMDSGEPRPRFEMPLFESDDMAVLAGEIIEHHHGQPVADYAALYLLEAYNNNVSTMYSAEDAREVVMDIAGSTADPLVLDHAVAMLSAADMDDDARAFLQRRFEATGDPDIAAAIARTLSDAAFARKDWDAAEAWILELRKRRGDLCSEFDPHRCELLDNEILQSLAQIAVARGERPDRWDSAVSAAVWRCHLTLPLAGSNSQPQSPRPVIEIAGSGIWADGDWTWWSWSQQGGELDTAFSTCVERETAGLPEPPPPDRVSLRITRI